MSFLLTSAPKSIKNLKISIESISNAAARGQELISKEFHKKMNDIMI